MLNVGSFIECITENLKKRNFSKDRIDTIVKTFQSREKFHTSTGRNDVDSSIMAMRDVFDYISKEATEKAKRNAATIAVHATHINDIAEGLKVDTKAFTLKDLAGKQVGPRGSRGRALAMAAVNKLEKNPNFSGESYSLVHDVTTKQLFSLFGADFDKIAIGMLGKQKGKAHISNLADEMFSPGSTGDRTAEALANAWDRVGTLGVDMFNQFGGSMNKLPRYLPQPFNNTAKLVTKGQEHFVSKHLDLLDWNKTRHPDGTVVPPEERAAFLKDVYRTKSTDGVNKIDPDSYRGNGRALGNALDQHRVFHYKDAAAWKTAHEEWGDGTVFDVMVHHVEDLSHRIAMVKVFGPNPDLAMKNIESIVLTTAEKNGIVGKELEDVKDVLSSNFQPMFQIMTRKNPMNPHSVWGATVTGANNLNTAALLGHAFIASTLGDAATTKVVKAFNGMPIFGGIDTMIRGLATDPAGQRQIAIQSGFIMDGMARPMSSVERFNPAASIGPVATRRLADITIRGTGMNAMTNQHRWAGQVEQMGFMHTLRDKPFEKLPIKAVMEKYGITAKDWDAVRKIAPFSPREGANWMRPIDILQSGRKDAQELYYKFQGMVLQESYHMVPNSTLEATTSLRGTTRPNTILGTISFSFSAFKNFPMTYGLLFGRLGMRQDSSAGRVGFYATTAAATTIAGVVATQLNEVAKGRDTLPWSDPRLILRGFMKGGGAGLLGEFAFADVGEYGQDVGDVISGPTLGLYGDITALAFGDTKAVIDSLAKDGDLDNFDSKTLERAVQLARRITPGSNYWHSGLVVQRKFWDAVEDAVDPKARRKRDKRMRKQEREFGNEYYWRLGDGSPDRAPNVFSEE